MSERAGYGRYAGFAAAAAAAVGLLYSVAFVVLRHALLSSVCLLLGGLLSLVALVGLFARLGEVDTQAALLGLALGAASALGAAVHGGYDLANALNPPGALPDAVAALPNPVDPRGLLTFGAAGLSLFVAAGLMRRHAQFRSLALPTVILAALLVIVYLGRLIILSPGNPLVLVPAALTGFIVNPLWYLMLAARLRQPAAVQTDAVRPQAA